MLSLDDQVKDFFRPGGALSSESDFYEFRRQQLDMAIAVSATLQSEGHIMIEAPTGVGKSFAYLVPSVYYAKKNGRKVVVSTYSINLQEQLIDKDIPLLKKSLGFDFSAKLLKGRKNYLCPNRLMRALESGNTLFETEEQRNLMQIYDWSKQSKDGTVSDMNFRVIDEVWDTVCSERGICTPKTCGGENTRCFYQKARQELDTADVVVLNHHLFFTLFDAIKEDARGYLFLNDFLVFDEAHTLEQVAADHISPHVSREMLKYNLLRLYNGAKKRGFLLSLPSLHIQMQVSNLLDVTNSFFYKLRRASFGEREGRSLTARVYEAGLCKNELKPELDKLIGQLKSLMPACQNLHQENELTEFITRFSEINRVIDSFVTQKHNNEDNEFVYWVELSSARPESNIKLCSSPVDLSGFFRKNIFAEGNTSILTSATLTTGRDFSYMSGRLGAEEIEKLMLGSPFDYARQVKVFIPRYMPSPSKEQDESYFESLKEWISRFVKMTDGKALVLFTNRSLLQRTGEKLKEEFESEGIELLMQGKGISRRNLLDRFRENIRSVLFGLDSFWMGVDVPGESLSNLIVTRLPFQVPDHPLVKARLEFIEKTGGNSFLEYSLPEAVLKFRQGVGRLIRNSEDKGIIVILDNRIISKPYGRNFIDSIDDCPVEIVTPEDVESY